MKKRIVTLFAAFTLIAGTLAGCHKTTSTSTSAETATATSTSTVAEYAVNFVNWDNTILETVMVKEGNYATYSKELPTKASDTAYSYTFKGWDKDPASTKITAMTTFTAQFNSATRKYMITFYNLKGDAKPLQKSEAEYNAQYSIPTGSREKTSDRIGWHFDGWDANDDGVTDAKDAALVDGVCHGELTAYGIFSQIAYVQYTFYADEAKTTVLEQGFVQSGAETVLYHVPGPEKTPTKAGDDDYGAYSFYAWDPYPSFITADTSYAPTFRGDEATRKTYVVSINVHEGVDATGTTVEYWHSDKLHVGDKIPTLAEIKAAVGSDPVKQSINEASAADPATHQRFEYLGIDVNGDNTFDSADVWPSTVQSSMFTDGKLVLNAVFQPVRQYRAQFKPGYTGTNVPEFIAGYDNVFVDWDKSASTMTGVVPPDPIRPSDAQYGYVFAGWDVSVTTVWNADTVFTATWTSSTNKYTITIQDPWTLQVRSGDFAYGTTSTAYLTSIFGSLTRNDYDNPNAATGAPHGYHYAFKGYSADSAATTGTTDLPAVTGNATYYEVWTQNVRYAVEWNYYSSTGTSVTETTYVWDTTKAAVGPTGAQTYYAGGANHYFANKWTATSGSTTASTLLISADTVLYAMYTYVALPKKMVACGTYGAIMLMQDGSLYGWGWIYPNMTDDATSSSKTLYGYKSREPYLLSEGTNAKFVDVAANETTVLAVDDTGALWGAGDGSLHIFGDNDTLASSYNKFTKLTGNPLTKIKSIALSPRLYDAVPLSATDPIHTCHAVAVAGEGAARKIYAWGTGCRNEFGLDSSTYVVKTPTEMHSGSSTVMSFNATDVVTPLASGWASGCLVKASGTDFGTLYTCGGRAYGEVGNGSTANFTTPSSSTDYLTAVSGSYSQVAAGDHQMWAINSSHALVGWGRNDSSHPLGIGTPATTDVGVATPATIDLSLYTFPSVLPGRV
jgi:hypothetical protein